MLHASELKSGDRHEIELAEGVGDRGIALEELEGAGVQVEDRLAIARHLGRVGLAVEHAERSAVAHRGLDFEVACDESHEIGRQPLSLRKRDDGAVARDRARQLGPVGRRLPLRGVLQRHRPSSLEVRLIKHRERQPRPRRHEQGVEEIDAAVERCIAGGELDTDLVGARDERLRRRHDVAVHVVEV